jgi:hypothetical protein
MFNSTTLVIDALIPALVTPDGSMLTAQPEG